MMTRYFPFPLTTTALLVVGCFTIGLMIAVQAGVVGIVLAAPLVAWFFRYCYLLVDAILSGASGPPAVTFDIVNPIAEWRPIAQALLIAAGVALVLALIRRSGFFAGALATGLLLLWLPASIAVLAATGHPLLAIWPPVLSRYARACGREFRQATLVILFFGGLLFGLLRFAAPLWITFCAVQLMLLVGFALVAGAMFEHRQALGIDPENRASREAERAARHLALQRRRSLERAYLKLKLGTPVEAWKEILTWLHHHGRDEQAVSERRAILEITSRWDDTRPADRIADELIGILLAARESGSALAVLELRLGTNPRFRPSSSHRARLAEIAGIAGKPALRRHLETSFTGTQTIPGTTLAPMRATRKL